MVGSGTAEIVARPTSFRLAVPYLLFALLGVFLAAAHEELLTRGYFLKALEGDGHPVLAVVATSAVFSLIHLTNDNLSIVALLNIFLFGCLLASLCITYGSLWLPFGLHVGWNFVLYLLNFPISGQRYPNPLLRLRYHEHTMLPGSRFGPEDSAVLTLLLVLAIGWLVRRSIGHARSSPAWSDNELARGRGRQATDSDATGPGRDPLSPGTA